MFVKFVKIFQHVHDLSYISKMKWLKPKIEYFFENILHIWVEFFTDS